ncbi:DUF5134 domain-containing protein [Actinoplanes subtropicus]|uniref:DUF5134 domain-containing protein n=1 Tax=Actinoplanes subtropicus TaxID=543632 RepID=UPI0006900143|nr:DUF5134 domain-containing protein [Actinoplanes subtropicus]
MIGLASLRWALTCALAVATMFHLVRVLRPAGAGFVDEVLHLFMGGSMIAMIWPWGSGVPAGVWVTGFTLATAWFVSRAILAPGRRHAPIYFASATAAMLWMAATTSAGKGGMAGMSGMGQTATTGHPAWISAALGAYLVAAALWWTARGMHLRPAGVVPQAPRWPEVCHATMSAAMGLALLAMT